MSLTPKQQQIFQARLNSDLATRSVTGTFIYVAVWVMLSCNMIYKDGRDELLTWLIACTGVLAATSIYRGLVIRLSRNDKYSLNAQHRLLISGAFISSLTWGLICSLSFLDTPLDQHSNVMLLSTVALAAGGTLTLFASKPVLNALLMGLLLPTIFIQIVFIKNTDYEVCSILLIFFFGLMYGSKSVCREYANSLIRNILLEELSSQDQLTGLKNRGYFDKRLEEEFNLAILHEHHRPLSLIILDIDYFKKINDNFGHLSGDHCLQTVAEILLSRLDSDIHTVARYGGEEFVLLLTKTDHKQCVNIAEELRKAIQFKQVCDKTENLKITASFGCYTLENYGGSVSAEDMLRYADEALYESKENGRNRVTFYSGLENKS